MTKRLIIALFVAVLAGVTLGLWRRATHDSVQAPAANLIVGKSNSLPGSATPGRGLNALETLIPKAAEKVAGDAAMALILEKILHENQPIKFYARVVDQDGTPVEGAQLELRLTRVDEEKVRAKFPKMNMGEEQVVLTNILSSDSRGWMQLTGVTGRIIEILNVSKTGYISRYPHDWNAGITYEPGGKYGFNADIQLTNALNPAKGYTFQLWKKGPAQSLIPISFGANLAKGPPQAWFALFHETGTETSETDADFAISEFLLFPGDSTRPYDRRVSIQGLNGLEMTETLDQYPYAAPQTGYISELHYDVLPSQGYGPNATWDWKKNFYFKARNGRLYGTIMISFDASKMEFGISGFLNPNGSRNLEPDPEKLITDPAEIHLMDEKTR